MTGTVYISEALPGVGKTQTFIESISDQGLKDHVVYALPTIALIKDVKERFLDEGIPALTINSESHEDVIKTVSMVLEDRRDVEPVVLIITHVSLRSISPYCLKGWKLIIDEIPDISNSGTRPLGENTYTAFLKRFVKVDEDSCEATLEDGCEDLVKRTCKESLTDKSFHVVGNMLAALVDPCVDVYIKPNISDDKYQFNCVSYHDYTKHIQQSNETHILGNAVRKSLLYLHLDAQGFRFETSRYQPTKRPYKLSPVLVPLYKGDKFSKTMMFTDKQGNVHPKWSSDISGSEIIDNAMTHNGDDYILTQLHSWCDYDFSESNTINTGFDARGLNTYSRVHRTLNLIHSNSNSIEEQLNTLMLEKMNIDVEEGKEAIRYSRCLEMIVQHICRTSIRTFDQQQEPTQHYVPNEKMAEDIQKALQIKCIIDRSIMIDPPVRKTSSKSERELNKAKAKEMKEKGYSNIQIADELVVTRQTIYNWLK